MQVRKLGIVLLIFSFLVSSCSFSSLPNDVKKSINSTDEAINKVNKKFSAKMKVKNNNFNYDMDTLYISNVSIQRKDTDFLPVKFNNQIKMDGSFTSMNQIADTLNKVTKYPVLVDDDSIRNISIRVTQNSGTLVDLLNNICAKTDTSWNFKEGKIILSSTETKTWFIKGIPGDIQVQNQINSNNGIQGSGGSGGSGNQSQSNNQMNTIQNIQFNLANSLWDNMKNAIQSMLSNKGKLSILSSTSSVTVTDKPSVIIKVGSFIKQQNEMLSKQVQIDVQVLSVETKSDDNYGINWKILLRDKVGFSINGQAPLGSKGDVNVFSPAVTTQAFTIGGTTGGFLDGSSLIINALSSSTKMSMVTSVAATTLNNQPVPVEVVRQQGYVSNTTSTMNGNNQTQFSLQTGQINYGFVLNILPVIEANNLVNLQISINLSDLKNLEKYAVGDEKNGSSVQLPNLIQRNTMQKTTMRSGDTYVITGFDSDTNSITNSGVGGTKNWLLGGGVTANKNRTKLVILVTPRIVNI